MERAQSLLYSPSPPLQSLSVSKFLKKTSFSFYYKNPKQNKPIIKLCTAARARSCAVTLLGQPDSVSSFSCPFLVLASVLNTNPQVEFGN